MLEAFWLLYSEKRIEHITVKEIVAKAGYNRGTFYEYFRDIHECLEHFETLALPTLEDLPPRQENLEFGPNVFETFIDLYREKYRYFNILLSDRGDPSFRRRLIDSLKITLLRSTTMKEEVGEGIEADYALEFLLSGLIGVLVYYFQQDPRPPETQVMTMMAKILGEWGLKTVSLPPVLPDSL